MRGWIISGLLSAVVLGGASHWARTYWEDYQSSVVEKARQTELLAHYEKQLSIKDRELARTESTHAELAREKEILENDLVSKEQEINKLQEDFSDEVMQCLEVYVAPALVN